MVSASMREQSVLKWRTPGGGVDFADGVAPGGGEAGELGDPGSVGAGGAADEDFAVGDEDVAAFDEAVGLGDLHDLRIEGSQVGGHFGGLAQPRGGAGAQDDGALRQAEGGVLDEDAVGVGVERREFDDGGPGLAQGGDVGGVVGLHQREIGGPGIDGAQAPGDRRRRRPGDGMGETGGKGHALRAQGLAPRVSHPGWGEARGMERGSAMGRLRPQAVRDVPRGFPGARVGVNVPTGSRVAPNGSGEWWAILESNQA